MNRAISADAGVEGVCRVSNIGADGAYCPTIRGAEKSCFKARCGVLELDTLR